MNNKQEKTYFKEWLPARVAILGAGRSGIAVARYLLKKGIAVFISETCGAQKLDFMLASNSMAEVPHEADGHTDKVLAHDLIVISPGVESDIPVLKKAREAGIPVWSEVELAYRQSRAPFLAVTGSTGKSTTVEMLGSILTVAGKENVVAGNIGLPLVQEATGISADGFVVAEISSFQLETVDTFRPHVAAILNLMKNHLDRYAGEEEYYAAKKLIARNMLEEDSIVLNALDKRLVAWAEQLKGKVRIVFFGADVPADHCAWVSGSRLFWRSGRKKEVVAHLASMILQGVHNRQNASAAAAMALAAGIGGEAIEKGIVSFRGLAHRMEFVRELDGISYYNDSKATTAESVECAVKSFSANVHLIAGGKDKGCDFSSIRDAIKNNVKSVTLIGEAAERISKEWEGTVNIARAASLEQALEKVQSRAGKGDVVILSPGCSSFDMFSSYEERGTVFKKLVNGLS